MVKIFINNEITYVPFNSTVLEACESAGIEIPRFCFHERLSIAGNCRMCLVELEKTPKPVASCAMPVMNNMRIFTDTPLVKKAREGVLEFLLLNHPLDCPICDQGGECDLQDQTMVFGADRSRFFEFKRGVVDKNCGPLIKTIMTRCIHCTRCVRFASDIAGIEDLGTTNRGRDTEIGTYVSKVFQTELSGNVIDLCPVGALTSKVYAFIARPWELRSTETIDFSDAVGSNIRVDLKETEVVRVLPRVNEAINEEWISDKARFNFDSLKTLRFDTPYIKNVLGNLESCSWQKAIAELENLFFNIPSSKIAIVCSVNLGLMSLHGVQNFANSLGVRHVGFPRKFYLESDFPEHFLCNTTLDNIKSSDFCLFVGTNPRYEASMLNLKIRKRFRQGLFESVSIGIPHNSTYKTQILGISPSTLIDISEGRHFFCKKLKKSKTPVLICGASLAERKDFLGLESSLKNLFRFIKVVDLTRNGFCFLNQESNQVGAFLLGMKSIELSILKKQKLCIFVGPFREDELSIIERFVNSNIDTKIVTFGVNGCDFSVFSNLILPTTTVFEQEDAFINLEGKKQKTLKVTTGPVLSRNITDILKIINTRLNLNSSFLSKDALWKTLHSISIPKVALKKNQNSVFFIYSTPFLPFLTDFHISDSFSRFSNTMLSCSNAYRASFINFLK